MLSLGGRFGLSEGLHQRLLALEGVAHENLLPILFLLLLLLLGGIATVADTTYTHYVHIIA
jgi:hypothetical protein